MASLGKALALLAVSTMLGGVPALAQSSPGSHAKGGGGQGKAAGTPQRSEQTPPGILQVLQRSVPGIQRALTATQGSNSRLQDTPASP
jgi:hypothetical protein